MNRLHSVNSSLHRLIKGSHWAVSSFNNVSLGFNASDNECSIAQLYRAVYEHILSRDDVKELTVEDPAEAFEDLRDKNDLLILLNNKKFMEEAFGSKGSSSSSGKIGPPVDRKWAEKWRQDLKIAGV